MFFKLPDLEDLFETKPFIFKTNDKMPASAL